MVCKFSKTTNIIAKMLAEINPEMVELEAMVLQNGATTDNLLLKHNFGCQQFPDTCCFNVLNFSCITEGQIHDLCKEIKSLK